MNRFSRYLSSLRRTLQSRPLTRSPRRSFRPGLEALEARDVPAVFTVINTLASGAGSLRQAILDANNTANVGGVADRIVFNITGASTEISFGTALPDVTEAVVIDGTTQPGFTGTPVVKLEGLALVADGLVLRDHF